MDVNDPIARFGDAMTRAVASEKTDPTATSLATADTMGVPSLRMVLLKGWDERGFIFYTNRDSRKAAELDSNPSAALCWYWPVIGEQVRVEGTVERVSDADSDAYFASRPRESQLGAWASRQSRPLEAYDLLQQRFADLTEMYEGKTVPRPRWWGGYRVIPSRIEFWKAGLHRLHHREAYVRADDGGWRVELLNP